MAEKIAENLYRIPVGLPGSPLKELNSYLICDKEKGNLLVDTGFRLRACRADLDAGLAELGVKQEETDIFLTHLHSDHAGLAPDLIAPQRHIFISAIDRSAVEDEENSRVFWSEELERFRHRGVPEDVIVRMRTDNPAVLGAPRWGCDQYMSVQPGDIFERGGYRFEAIATPGHTPGHMCLWDAAQGILLCGDHVLFDITPNITSWPSMPDALGSYLASLDLVGQLDVKLALPGHRKSGDFAARVQELKAHHRLRLDEAARIVRAESGLPANDITGRMQWSIRARNWDDFPPAQKIFAIGEACAHLDHLERCGRVKKVFDGTLWRYFPPEL